MADLTTRVVNILKSPQTEWPVIAAEPSDVGTIFKTYVIPLAAIGPICSWLSSSLIGTITPFGAYRMPLAAGLAVALLTYGFALVSVFLCAIVIEWLAPKFKSSGSRVDALKMVAYASTAGWVAGVFSLLPILGTILIIIASLYGIYLFYLGLPPVLHTPPDQVVPFMIVAALIIIVISFIAAMIVGSISAALFLGAAAMAM